MQVKVQAVTITDDGQETTRGIAYVERQDLTPATFGLSLAAGKAVLQAVQEVVVDPGPRHAPGRVSRPP